MRPLLQLRCYHHRHRPASPAITLAPSSIATPALAPPPPALLPSSLTTPRPGCRSVMACAAVASSVSAAVAPATQVWEAKTLSRHGLALAAPRASALKVANRSRIVMSAAPQSDKNVASLTGLALLAAAVVPEIAEAAQPGISPSLRNLLLSVVAGGTVLTVIGVAVAGVSTFDPVKRK